MSLKFRPCNHACNPGCNLAGFSVFSLLATTLFIFKSYEVTSYRVSKQEKRNMQPLKIYAPAALPDYLYL